MVQSKKLLIVVAILALSLVPRFTLVGVRTVLEQSPVKPLPERVGEWEGEDMPIASLVEKVLPPGTECPRKCYRKPATKDSATPDILVTVVTSATDKRSIHRPERCLPGQGWQIISRDRWPVPLSAGADGKLEVTRMVVRQFFRTPQQERVEVRLVVFYWFMSPNRLTGSNLKRLTFTSWDRVFRGLNYRWSCAQLMSPVTGSVAETSAHLTQFASRLLPLIYPRREAN